ncbi:MAG TPA: anti-sigma-D factor RsdA [Aldersonia sp.]
MSDDAAPNGAPVDIGAVRRDDALIDAIAGDGPVATDSAEDYQLATLLAGWRAEIVTPPMPAGPDLDAVVAAVNQEIEARNSRMAAKRRLRLLRPIGGAAAVLALVAGVATAFSYNAQPGDPLWKVKQVVFSEQADSTMARVDTATDLDVAEQMIASGDVQGAEAALERASTRAGDVNEQDDRDGLIARWTELTIRIEALVPTTTVLPPPPSEVPTPLVVSPTETTATTDVTTDATTTVDQLPTVLDTPLTTPPPPPVVVEPSSTAVPSETPETTVPTSTTTTLPLPTTTATASDSSSGGDDTATAESTILLVPTVASPIPTTTATDRLPANLGPTVEPTTTATPSN